MTEEEKTLKIEETTPIEDSLAQDDGSKKKKRRRRGKKKGGKKPAETGGFYSNGQTFPPTKPVSSLYSDGKFPCGIFLPYDDEYCTTHGIPEEMKKVDAKSKYDERIHKLREAAEVHREVRDYAKKIAKPGMKLYDFCADLESRVRMLCGEDSKIQSRHGGLAFPCGVSLNHVAAHYTPNPGDDTIFTDKDMMKVDFGSHIDGELIDSAFTICFNHELDPVVKASEEATRAAIKAMKPDMHICDVTDIIEEVICSYSCTIDGKTYDLQPIRNLSGHLVGPFRVHDGKSVPNGKHMGSRDEIIEEGELYAIETFASTGRGLVRDSGVTSHYMLTPFGERGRPILRLDCAKKFLSEVKKNHRTLAWCPRWFHEGGVIERYMPSIGALEKAGAADPYPPLADRKGSYVSQYEHTVLLREGGAEVMTGGVDF
ncbi:Methionine aminopeptidase 2B [Aduncisulcus paluster]|uniref:Methionine aminopeptidase 2 n=1 Tax=Aduncisulcus paluster TaxID=2918883 RepID=A0ABQ5KX58_9EUKA|nr:Methionine aminopeptidase 2B [Aduncisulcus paluster]|eukprot:gnl/Carplike_NY0171/1101_a1498_1215.p1 GENE.gnl/Carplike_NY0171/1101_a1498_1215~~gnl/Carplike_NY0171/1101_a1498_1215.p1  ORF type:complete len:428 (-),score=138.25 gnl/Carplike_NY0171/1101_a1498_1215:123-1406(-)